MNRADVESRLRDNDIQLSDDEPNRSTVTLGSRDLGMPRFYVLRLEASFQKGKLASIEISRVCTK
jgi:hypothetical protein